MSYAEYAQRLRRHSWRGATQMFVTDYEKECAIRDANPGYRPYDVSFGSKTLVYRLAHDPENAAVTNVSREGKILAEAFGPVVHQPYDTESNPYAAIPTVTSAGKFLTAVSGQGMAWLDTNSVTRTPSGLLVTPSATDAKSLGEGLHMLVNSAVSEKVETVLTDKLSKLESSVKACENKQVELDEQLKSLRGTTNAVARALVTDRKAHLLDTAFREGYQVSISPLIQFRDLDLPGSSWPAWARVLLDPSVRWNLPYPAGLILRMPALSLTNGLVQSGWSSLLREAVLVSHGTVSLIAECNAAPPFEYLLSQVETQLDMMYPQGAEIKTLAFYSRTVDPDYFKQCAELLEKSHFIDSAEKDTIGVLLPVSIHPV